MIILDTNVIMAFLLTDGITHQIIEAYKDVFVAPEYCFEEIWEHKDVWNRKKLPENDLRMILDEVKRLFIYSVSEDMYDDKLAEASELINDPDDVPIVALALAIHNEGIWTHDKHFSPGNFKAISGYWKLPTCWKPILFWQRKTDIMRWHERINF